MEKKRNMLIALGVLVALVPHLGFPNSLKGILGTILGLVVIVIAYMLGKSHRNLPAKAKDLHPSVSLEDSPAIARDEHPSIRRDNSPLKADEESANE